MTVEWREYGSCGTPGLLGSLLLTLAWWIEARIARNAQRRIKPIRDRPAVRFDHGGDRPAPVWRDAYLRPLVGSIAEPPDHELVPAMPAELRQPPGEFGGASVALDDAARHFGANGSVSHDAIVGTRFRKSSADLLEICAHDIGVPCGHRQRMAGRVPKAEDVEIGRRLRQTRKAIRPEMSLRQFAALVGVEESLLSKYEKGGAAVSRRYMRQLKSLFGVTFDWIVDGDPSHLPAELHAKLLRAQRDDED